MGSLPRAGRQPAKTAPIGARIRWKRQRLECSQSELGERLGLDQTTVSRHERAERPDRVLPYVAAYAAALGVSRVWLLGNTKGGRT